MLRTAKQSPCVLDQRTSDLTPVPRKHLDTELRLRGATSGPPAVEIPFREAMITIGRVGFVECSDRLAQNLTPARAVRATEPSVDGLFVGAQTPSAGHSAPISRGLLRSAIPGTVRSDHESGGLATFIIHRFAFRRLGDVGASGCLTTRSIPKLDRPTLVTTQTT
jgi:hypothetical protein